MSATEDEPAGRFRLALAALSALGLGLRLAAVVRPMDILDRWFIPDDTYYVLAIARSMADGLGPAANGEVLTSGFQPLLAFLLVPVFALTSSIDLPIRATVLLLSVCDAANVALLGWLVRRWQGTLAGLVAAGLWAVSPIALDNALGGLETALALTALLSVTGLWMRHRDGPSARSAAALGLVIGLALLARVDTVFLVLLVGLVELVGRQRRYLVAIVISSLAVVAPWWGYCLSRFGSILPDSGAAAREVAHAYQGGLLSPLSKTLWATWTILGPPFAELRSLRVLFYTLPSTAPILGFLVGMVGLCVLSAAFFFLSVRVARTLDGVRRPPFVALVVHGVIIAAFYAHYVPVLWFFRRYTSPTALVATVLISSAAAWGWKARQRLPGRAVLVLVGAGAVVALGGVGQRLVGDPGIAEQQAVDGPTGYRAPTLELLAAVPYGSVVSGIQSGALSYFAPVGVTVHNLDGVVDRAAAAAFRERELGALMRKRGITHFVDWQLQHDMAVDRAGAVPFTLEDLATASFEQQSHHRLMLSEVRW